MNESDTRLNLIDPQLKAAGWGVVPLSTIATEQNAYLIAPGRINSVNRRPKRIDYLLIYKGVKIAIVEAKSEERDVHEGVDQAKTYADMMKIRFTYSTNGRQIWAIDMETGKEGLADRFPTPDELWQRLFPLDNIWRDRFNSQPYNRDQGKEPRYYQELAISRALGAISLGQKRILLNLATGTGKTYIASQICWKLFQTGWNRNAYEGGEQRNLRILFLTDRNFLANQALNDFGIFPADSYCRITPENLRNGMAGVEYSKSLYFTIFQTLMTGSETPAYRLFPDDFFDLVIIDECHRGGANDESQWREVMDYFDQAYQIGLTATPRRSENVNTYQYFGEPVYTYSLKQGIEDGYLTPYRVYSCRNLIDEYQYNPDDDVVSGEIDPNRVYTERDFYRGDIVMRQRDELRVMELLDHINPGDKSIVFCASQLHAMVIRDMINQHSKTPHPFYCVRVTADDGDQGETQLHHFEDNDKTLPTILTTSQKLSTGLDARNVRNIVLMRPVNSIIEFKQIIGRGTRLFDDKYYFTIYDFVGAAANFNDPEWDGEPDWDIEDPPRQKRAPGGCQGGTKHYTPHVCPICQCSPCICEHPDEETLEVVLNEKRMIRLRRQAVWEKRVQFDGELISLEDFIKILFEKLPSVFGSVDNLRTSWSSPDTRKELLRQFEERNIDQELLEDVKVAMGKEDCDLFDVLQYLAFDIDPIERRRRVDERYDTILSLIPESQREFFAFILANYVRDGESVLDIDGLEKLLKLKYNDSATDGIEAMKTTPKDLRINFLLMQQNLYSDNRQFNTTTNNFHGYSAYYPSATNVTYNYGQ